MKKLSIFLAFVMLFTMIPMTALAAETGYKTAATEIKFSDFAGTGNTNGPFNIVSDLNLIKEFPASDNVTYPVTWSSSDPSLIDADGKLTDVVSPVDRWVRLTAVVSDPENSELNGTTNFDLCIKAEVDEGDYILQRETFDSITAGTAIKETAVNGWAVQPVSGYTADDGNTDFTVVDSAAVKADTSITVDDNITVYGNALQLKADTTSAKRNNLLVKDLGTMPESGLVSFSADFLFSGSSTQFYLYPFWTKKTVGVMTYPYVPAGTAFTTSTIEQNFGTNTWQNITVIYDLDNKTVVATRNGKLLFESAIPNETIENLGKIQMRLYEYSGDYAYIDNLEVKKLFVTEKETFAEFNPANKGETYVDKDLVATTDLNGISYPVTYESSDTSVIAADGTVTHPDFFRTVTVTPKIEIDGTILKGTTVSLTVLPIEDNYEEKMFEDFDSLKDVKEGDFFVNNGTTVESNYEGWYTNRKNAPTTYKKAQDDGRRTQLKLDDGNYVLNLLTVKDTSDYQMIKDIEDPECGDRGALIMRVKNLSNSHLQFSSSYTGLFNQKTGLWRGAYGSSSKYGDDVSVISLPRNEWMTLMFVYDKGITQTINEKECMPISLYVDGEYFNTSWTPTTTINPKQFLILQQGSYVSTTGSDIYIDDILLVNFDAEDVQFAGTTVTEGTLTNVELQYTSYGASAISGTVFAGAYDADGKLINVGVLGTVSAPAAGFHDLDVTDYALPKGTASYRLFLFDSVEGLRPLAVSKTYALQ